MKPTPYQNQILALARENGGQFTAAQACERFAGNYYCNGEKHVGDAVRRMVAAGFLRRVKKGVYAIETINRARQVETDPAQITLEL